MDQHEIVREAGDFDQNFLSLKQREMCYDVDVLFNDERMPLHSLILGGNSQFFEINLCNMPLVPRSIRLENMNTEATKTIIEYCYSGKMKLQQKDVLNVLKVAHFLNVKSAIKGCVNILKSILDSKNSLEIWAVARKLQLDELENSALDWIRKSFIQEITKDFFTLDMESLTKFLESSITKYHQEETFNIIKEWIKYDPEVRSKTLISLLRFVRLEDLSLKTLTTASKDICIVDSQSCILLIDAIAKQVNKESTGPNRKTLIVIGGWDLNNSKILETYDAQSNKWIEQELDIEKSQFSSIFRDKKIYTIGGATNSNLNVNTAEYYDVKTGGKSTLSPMYEGRDGFSTVVADDYIYAIGGAGNGRTPLSTMERFNMKTNQWTKLSSMPTARSYLRSVIVDGEIYVTGGSDGSELSINECYTISTGKWRKCCPMQERRMSHGIAFCHGFVYVVGGQNPVDVSSAEKYDPKADKWTYIKDINPPRYGVAAVNFCNDLIISGGYYGLLKRTDKVEQYDAQNDQWILLPSLNVARGHHNMIVVTLE